MIRILLFSVLFISSHILKASEPLWENNKLTSAQPFPGKVLAVESSWGGYRLFIESMDESGKYCVAQVWPGGGGAGLTYIELKKADLPKPDQPKPGVSVIFIDPPVEVSRFSWSMGVWKIGRIFGDEDCLKKIVRREAEESERKTRLAQPPPQPPSK